MVVTLTALLVPGSLQTGCGGVPGGTGGQTTLKRIQREKVVRIGYANEAPYAYKDSSTDELRGEAPAIARAVLQELGVDRVEGVLTEFGSLIPGLKAGRFDVIAAGMYITPLRCREIAFSLPTYSVGEAFLVRAGNPLGLHSYRDVAQHPDARLGVVAGAVQQGYAREAGIPSQRVLVFNDAPSALAGLRANRIDAYAGTSLTVNDLLEKAGNAEVERAIPFEDLVLDGKVIRGYGAFGFRLQDSELLKAFNESLADFIGSPAHRALVEPYGFTELELPGDVTVEELCGS